MKTKKRVTKRTTKRKTVAVRKPNPMTVLAQRMETMVQSLDSRITSMGEAIGRFDQYREQINQRLSEIVDVLSERLQTMANTLQAPTYVIESRGTDGKYRTLNILSVGSFAGTVKIQVQLNDHAPGVLRSRPLDAAHTIEAAQPVPLAKDEVDPLLQR